MPSVTTVEFVSSLAGFTVWGLYVTTLWVSKC